MNGPEWRNWQTHETQNLAPVTRRVGSIPSSGTIRLACNPPSGESQARSWWAFTRSDSTPETPGYFVIVDLSTTWQLPVFRSASATFNACAINPRM
jgi:hypothetical protein